MIPSLYLLCHHDLPGPPTSTPACSRPTLLKAARWFPQKVRPCHISLLMSFKTHQGPSGPKAGCDLRCPTWSSPANLRSHLCHSCPLPTTFGLFGLPVRPPPKPGSRSLGVLHRTISLPRGSSPSLCHDSFSFFRTPRITVEVHVCISLINIEVVKFFLERFWTVFSFFLMFTCVF